MFLKNSEKLFFAKIFFEVAVILLDFFFQFLSSRHNDIYYITCIVLIANLSLFFFFFWFSDDLKRESRDKMVTPFFLLHFNNVQLCEFFFLNFWKYKLIAKILIFEFFFLANLKICPKFRPLD